MNAILALDQGTTSSRAIGFDHNGVNRGVAQHELTQIFPDAGWVEHDPLEIWRTQIEVARAVLKRVGMAAADIAAIGITNQRETTVLWDRKTGEPVYNAIIWQDRRTAGFCDELRAAGHGDLIRERTGLVIDAYFAASKLRWLLDNVPGARKRAERGELAFGTIESWLVWQLTQGGRHVTDVSNASRTMLFNLRTGTWDEELLRLFEIPRDVLPEVRSSSEAYAETAPGLFGAPIKIAGMAGDQQAALFGQNCFERGLAKNTYGTGCFMLMNIGNEPTPSRHQLLTTAAWQQDGRTDFALEGSVFIGGAVVQWLRDGIGIIKTPIRVASGHRGKAFVGANPMVSGGPGGGSRR
jgi:glycerol kinase